MFDYKIINFFDKHCDVNYKITARWRASLPNYGTISWIRCQTETLERLTKTLLLFIILTGKDHLACYFLIIG